MRSLKINWQSKLETGFLLLLALFLIAESIFVFCANSQLQKIGSALVAIYLLVLIIKKYPNLLKMALAIMIGFTCLLFFEQKEKIITASDLTELVVYHDEVKIKDGYLSGIAHWKNQRLLIAGKLAKNQERQLKKSSKFALVDLEGQLAEIFPATNQGEFDFRRYYASQKIQQQYKFTSCQIKVLRINFFEYFHLLRFRLQTYFKKMPKRIGFFASELTLAENPSRDNQDIIENYRNLGVIHLLSISGLHVSLYVLAITAVCYWLKFTEEETFLLCALILLVEIFLSNFQAGFVRASLSFFLARFCKFNKIKLASVDLLSLTCMIHLFLRPRLFMSIGAILSYLLVFGLKISNNMPSLIQSLALNALVLPLLLANFYQINLASILFNLLIVPYFNFLVIPLTLLSALLFPTLPVLAEKSNCLLEKTEHLIGVAANSKLGLLTFGQINWWTCLVLFLLTLFIVTCLAEKKINVKLIKKLVIVTLSGYLCALLAIHCPLTGQVTLIDVGQGDSILITTSFPRKTYMIDTGGKLNFSSKKITPQVNRITIPFLKSMGITKIDGLFVSHQDADHVGDVRPLMQQIRVKNLYLAKGLLKNPSFKKRIDGVSSHTKIVELLAGMQVKEAQINFEVVYPFKEGRGKNEDSLSVTFVLANKRWLFTGDLDQNGEKMLIEKFPMKVDYFKLGHHGSKTASNPDFLKKINPELVFISAGRNNRFGHPHPETMQTLQKQQIKWASTQDCGMISWYYNNRRQWFRRFLVENGN